MPVQIGGPPDHGFQSPLQLLSDCHRRIEHFLNVLERVGMQAGDALTSEEETALQVALRYFREAAPKHTQDEEESLFPRLQQAGHPEAREALAKIEMLESDHVRAATFHEEIERLGQKWAGCGKLEQAERVAFQTRISDLKLLYRTHIDLEDTVIFPLSSKVLNREEQVALGLEMAARRRG